LGPRSSAKLNETTSRLSRRRSEPTRSYCRCSVASLRNSFSCFSTRSTSVISNMFATSSTTDDQVLLMLPVAPPGFCNRGEVRYGSIGGLEYEVPQSRLYCLCINVAVGSTALQCICRVIRKSSMTMKAHTYYIIFGRPPIGGSFPLFPRRRHWILQH